MDEKTDEDVDEDVEEMTDEEWNARVAELYVPPQDENGVYYADARPQDANWMQIVRGMLEPDGVTLTAKGRAAKEEFERKYGKKY